MRSGLLVSVRHFLPLVSVLSELPHSACGRGKFQIDTIGDNLYTCTSHSGAKKAHDWSVDGIPDLFVSPPFDDHRSSIVGPTCLCSLMCSSFLQNERISHCATCFLDCDTSTISRRHHRIWKKKINLLRIFTTQDRWDTDRLTMYVYTWYWSWQIPPRGSQKKEADKMLWQKKKM